jgi:hypothetical protein
MQGGRFAWRKAYLEAMDCRGLRPRNDGFGLMQTFPMGRYIVSPFCSAPAS